MSESLNFEEVLDRDGHLAYTNKGVSMLPLLRQGRDVMLIRKKGAEKLKKLDAVLFRRPQADGRDAYASTRTAAPGSSGTTASPATPCGTSRSSAS